MLYTLVCKDMANQSQPAGYLGIDRSVLPYVIDDLVKTGLVERQPDPADRRARKAVATQPGIETLRALQNKITSAEGIGAGSLGPCRAEAVPVAAGPPGPPGRGRRRPQGPDCVRRQKDDRGDPSWPPQPIAS
ncbi:MarR family transcriptional regulator [Streptomyces sp. H49]|uniref:MarR family transcriptional regulator n=1 Tax=Streptomyces sp. H49 TaxID=3444117 RepID=UPI003F4AE093